MFGKLFATVFSAAEKPAVLPIPESSPNRMSVKNVPPATGSELFSDASYTPFIPRYPIESSTEERARESRGPLKSASFPKNGAAAYTPTIRESRSVRCIGHPSVPPYSFHSDRQGSASRMINEGDAQVADRTLGVLYHFLRAQVILLAKRTRINLGVLSTFSSYRCHSRVRWYHARSSFQNTEKPRTRPERRQCALQSVWLCPLSLTPCCITPE